jgi:hypothetical protein
MKVFGSTVAATLLMTALAGVALAQGPDGDGDGVRDLLGTGSGPAWGFVDEDGDGINDRYNQNCDPSTFVDEDGDGVCDLRHGTFGQGYGGRGTNATGGAPSYGQWRYGANRGNSYGYGYGECDPIGDQMMMLGAGWGR